MNYKKTIWRDNSRISADALNNIENGIEYCINKVDSISSWALQKTKPVYTAEEVGALSDNIVRLHNIQGTAHQYLFNEKADKAQIEQLMQLIEQQNQVIEETKKTITTLKSSITKLKNEIKEIKQSIEE